MNCSKCGWNVQEGVSICPNCGAAITLNEMPANQTPVNEAPAMSVPAEPVVNPAPVVNTTPVHAPIAEPVAVPPTTVTGYMPQASGTMPQQCVVGAPAPQKKKSKLWLILLIIGLSVAIIVSGIIVVPKLLITPEKLMAEGDYIAAYEKADEEQKDDIIKANAVAFCSALCKDSLKDSESFNLREAWYREDTYSVILTVAANNSYGNTVINYWYYYWSESELEYRLMSNLTSLEDEEVNSWDDSDERLEKSIDNMSRSTIRLTMGMKNAEVSKEDIKVINNLSQQDILDTVELIDIYRNKNLNES